MPPATTSEMVFRYLTRGWVFSAASKDPAIFERRGKRIGSVTEQSYECYRRRKRRRLSSSIRFPGAAFLPKDSGKIDSISDRQGPPLCFFLTFCTLRLLVHPHVVHPVSAVKNTGLSPPGPVESKTSSTSRVYRHPGGSRDMSGKISSHLLFSVSKSAPTRQEAKSFVSLFSRGRLPLSVGFSSAFFSVSRPSPVLLITMCKCMGEFSGVSSPLDL
ncbi:putative transmembrane protein [Toxoplasma gondii RUB]|uniref:Putative transmembrane protein n=2 Tax=Toxoplasma gondii TaxID=5811 RepID=A0A086LYP3_TOXGO|nr:putative transmembrane protein [Toxoplasma gondii RUB]KFH02085.1 putative transmembrane protein [Toxoplasma gondii MAS]